MKDLTAWLIVAAILAGAGGVIAVVQKAWATALVGAGTVVLACALLFA